MPATSRFLLLPLLPACVTVFIKLFLWVMGCSECMIFYIPVFFVQRQTRCWLSPTTSIMKKRKRKHLWINSNGRPSSPTPLHPPSSILLHHHHSCSSNLLILHQSQVPFIKLLYNLDNGSDCRLIYFTLRNP